jgi:hypothetical protein
MMLLGGLAAGVMIGLFVPAGIAMALVVVFLIGAIAPQLKMYQMLFLGALLGDVVTVLIRYYGVVQLG